MMSDRSSQHMMIFEPRLEGHHMSWLRYISEDFLSVGFEVSWAVDYGPEGKKKLQDQLASLLSHVRPMSLFDGTGTFRGNNKVNAMAQCFQESGADHVFLNSFDEIASNTLRLAAFGIRPPEILRGRIGGVYLRPRFLAHAMRPPGNMIKALGFRNLCRGGWFKCIYLTDKTLLQSTRSLEGKSHLYFLPDPWSGDFSHQKNNARKALGISQDAFVFLNYGIGDRRKGLHLVLQALLDVPRESHIVLLCAGHGPQQRDVKKGLSLLQQQNKAHVLDRYVSDDEEALCFCSADVVLLPYIKHFGSSGVLSRAAAAGKMVIASDEGLIARLVQTHNLGWVVHTNNVASLRKAMLRAVSLSDTDLASFRSSALQYAKTCSRDAFRKALLVPYISG